MRKFSEDNLILLALTVFLILLLLLSFEYAPKARLMPLVVGIPTLALVVIHLLINVVPSLSEKYRKVREHDIFDLGEIKKKPAPPPGERKSPAEIGKKEVNIVWWLIGLMGAICVVGYLIAIPAFCFLFLKIRSGERWLAAIIVTAATWVFVYGVFVIVLKLQIYKGFLFGG